MTNTANKFLGIFLAGLVVFSTALAGVPAGVAAASSGNETLAGDGEIFWQGQTLTVDAPDNSSGHEATLRTADASNEFVAQYNIGSDSNFTLETSDLSGDYVLEFENTTKNYTFEVVKQTLNVEPVNDANATNGDTSASDVKYTLDSNRASYPVNVTSSTLTVSQLETVVGWGASDANVTKSADGPTIVTYNGVSDGEYSLNFTGVDAGQYDLGFNSPETTAQDTLSVSVSNVGDGTATFSKNAYSEQAGDVVTFDVNLENTQVAEVQVGDSSVGYTSNITVTDENADGVVTVQFNTADAGTGVDPFTTPSDSTDTVTTNDETNLSSPPLEATSYDLSASVSGSETDISSVSLVEGGVNGVSVGVLPQSSTVEKVSDLSGVVADNTVANGDYLVVSIDAAGFGGTLGDATDLSYTNTSGAYLNVTETTPEPNSAPYQIDVSKGTVYSDAANDTYYVVFDTSNFSAEVEPEDTYNAKFVADGDHNAYVKDGEKQTASTTFSTEKRVAEFSNVKDNVVQVVANENGTANVSGTTTLATGTELTVTVREEGKNPFLKSQTVTVQDGQFSAEYDFSGVEEGTNFTVQIRDLTDKKDATLVVESAQTTTTTTTTTVNTTTTTTEPEPTTTTTQEPTTQEPTTTTTEQPTTKSPGQPGFGVVAGLIAVLGAALIALRRD